MHRDVHVLYKMEYMCCIFQADTTDEDVCLATCYMTAMDLQLCAGHENLEEWRR